MHKKLTDFFNKPQLCFKDFAQSAVTARRQEDKNSSSSVVAETIKVLTKSSCGYQILDQSRHPVRKCLDVNKTYKATNRKLLKRPVFNENRLCDVEDKMSEIELEELFIDGLFILQNSKLRLLELYAFFYRKTCGGARYEELRRIHSSCTWLCSKKTWMTLFCPINETVGMQFVQKIDRTVSRPTQHTTSSENLLQQTPESR